MRQQETGDHNRQIDRYREMARRELMELLRKIIVLPELPQEVASEPHLLTDLVLMALEIDGRSKSALSQRDIAKEVYPNEGLKKGYYLYTYVFGVGKVNAGIRRRPAPSSEEVYRFLIYVLPSLLGELDSLGLDMEVSQVAQRVKEAYEAARWDIYTTGKEFLTALNDEEIRFFVRKLHTHHPETVKKLRDHLESLYPKI